MQFPYGQTFMAELGPRGREYMSFSLLGIVSKGSAWIRLIVCSTICSTIVDAAGSHWGRCQHQPPHIEAKSLHWERRHKKKPDRVINVKKAWENAKGVLEGWNDHELACVAACAALQLRLPCSP